MGSESLSVANRTRFWALVGALAVGILPWILPGRAHAFYVEATAGTYAFGGPNGYDQTFGALGTSASATSSGDGANSSASASAAMGTVGGFASASAVTRDTGFAQLATGQTWALFSDTISVGSGSLPVGTIVTLSIDTNLTGAIIGVAGGFEGRGSSNFSAGYLGGTAVATAEQRSDWINGNYNSNSGPITFNTTVGSLVPLTGRLDVVAIAEGVGQAGVASSVTASFGSTALFTVDALTPGVVLTSESGHNYSAIPEPATLALLAIGTLLITRRRA